MSAAAYRRNTGCDRPRGSAVSPLEACARRQEAPLRCLSTLLSLLVSPTSQYAANPHATEKKESLTDLHATRAVLQAHSQRTSVAQSRSQRIQHVRNCKCLGTILLGTKIASALEEVEMRGGIAGLQTQAGESFADACSISHTI